MMFSEFLSFYWFDFSRKDERSRDKGHIRALQRNFMGIPNMFHCLLKVYKNKSLLRLFTAYLKG